MIKVNNYVINQNTFPDGTPLIKMPSITPYLTNGFAHFNITWLYDNMNELFNLSCIVDNLNLNHKRPFMRLYLPYVPNARQDRVKTSEDVFTLKTFCNIINKMKFDEVIVNDIHSDVTSALLDNVIIENINHSMITLMDKFDLVFYPDNGAVHKYSSYLNYPYAYGVKSRDWATGKILELDIVGDVKDKRVLFVDDIIAYGGSLYFSALKLKEKGAKEISAYITHTELNFFDKEKGRAKDVLGTLVDKLYTTDSIFRPTEYVKNVEIINSFKSN